MKPSLRLWSGWVLLAGSFAGWPASVIWWAKDEPTFVLSLSWFALILTALDIIFTAQVAVEEERRDDDS